MVSSGELYSTQEAPARPAATENIIVFQVLSPSLGKSLVLSSFFFCSGFCFSAQACQGADSVSGNISRQCDLHLCGYLYATVLVTTCVLLIHQSINSPFCAREVCHSV